jgi:hypothetical protein
MMANMVNNIVSLVGGLEHWFSVGLKLNHSTAVVFITTSMAIQLLVTMVSINII